MRDFHFKKIAVAVSVCLLVAAAGCQFFSQKKQADASATATGVQSGAGALIPGVSGSGTDRNLGVELPPQAQPADVKVYDVNYWTEKDLLIVAGFATNNTPKWQRAYLKATFKNAAGKPVKINDKDEVYIPVASGSIPPKGRSSFCWTFDQFAFNQSAASCEVTLAGVVVEPAKNLLTAMDNNYVNVQMGDTAQATKPGVVGMQVSCNVFNPFEVTVAKPMMEMIIYGKDKKLWYATVVPLDSTDVSVFVSKAGPMGPQEKRMFGAGILFAALPQGLQQVGIGDIEFLPFDAAMK